jgi:hypothetical protein
VVGLIRELDTFTALLETQAQRSEGLETAGGAPASSSPVAALAEGCRRQLRALGRTYTLSCNSTRRRWSSPTS